MNNSAVALDLDESRLPLKVISLAWPVVAEQTFTTFVGLAGTIMVGRLGAAALAGIGLASQAIFIPLVMFDGIAVGATAVIARRIGEGKQGEASTALRQSVLMAAVIGLLFTPLIWFLAEPIMSLFRAQPDVVEIGAVYIRANAPGLAPSLVMFAANAAMRGAGDTRTPMLIMLVANIVNVALGYVLIYGFLGLPAMGVLGAGIAASVAWIVGCVAALGILVKGVGNLSYDYRRALSLDLAAMGRILTIGFPTGLENLQFQGAFTIYSIIISALGTTVYAAHTVALRVEGIAFMLGFGLGAASTTLVGQALGAGRPDLAQRAVKIAQWYSIALMTTLGVLMSIFRWPLMSVFVADRDVIEIGALSILIYAFAMPLMGSSFCLSGGLRGAGDTRSVLAIMTVGIWLVRLPLAYVLAYWTGLGAAGAWSAAVADINVRAIFIWLRFSAGRWKNIHV